MKLTAQLIQIVRDNPDQLKSNQGDLAYDLSAIDKAQPGERFVWILHELGTFLHQVGSRHITGVLKDQCHRLAHSQVLEYKNRRHPGKFFLVEVSEVGYGEVKEINPDELLLSLTWNPIPTRPPGFGTENIVCHCKEYINKVRLEAEALGVFDRFTETLKYLAEYRKEDLNCRIHIFQPVGLPRLSFEADVRTGDRPALELEGSRSVIYMGVVFNEDSKTWSLHS